MDFKATLWISLWIVLRLHSHLAFASDFCGGKTLQDLCPEECKEATQLACGCRFSVGTNSTTLDCSHSGVKVVPNFRNCPCKFTHLKLDSSGITVLNSNAFSSQSFSSLTYLSLANNNLSLIEKNAFLGLNSLESLILTNNNIFSNVASIALMFAPIEKTLKVLDIRRNVFSTNGNFGYPDNELRLLLHLRELYMDGVDNKALPSSFSQLKSLRKLSFSGGRTGVVHIPTDMFKAVPQLTELDLSGTEA